MFVIISNRDKTVAVHQTMKFNFQMKFLCMKVFSFCLFLPFFLKLDCKKGTFNRYNFTLNYIRLTL